MKVLVAGGAGFIGSSLCDGLLGRGDDVICLDNLITGRAANVEHLLADDRFTFLEHDLSRGLPATISAEAIYHLASPASPPGYKRNPLETLRVTSAATQHLLELALRTGARLL